jgi:hypothetical protein
MHSFRFLERLIVAQAGSGVKNRAAQFDVWTNRVIKARIDTPALQKISEVFRAMSRI